MAKRSGRGLRKDADYTEDLVGFALESFLTLVSFPRQRFSIEPFSRARERWLGADARLSSHITGFRPFYMQFKRPTGYPDFSTAGVIRDRKKLGLTVSPNALFFPLREKALHHRSYQHNVLLRLRQKLRHLGIGDAAYVCPLFLDRSAYRLNVHWAGLQLWPRFWRHYPWEFDDVRVDDGSMQIRFDRVPVFAEHVSIPPHAAVTHARHKYSFSEAGTELCFHSPEGVPDGARRLRDFFKEVSQGFLEEGPKLRPRESMQVLQDLIEATGERDAAGPISLDQPSDDPIGAWLSWGDHLKTTYDIDQYALIRWEA